MESSMDPPTMPVAAARRIVSATVFSSSPKPFSRSALTGRSVAAAISVTCASIRSRPTWLSSTPMENANPALVVASASKPSFASIFAVPTSQGFGMMKASGRACSARNASAFCNWVLMACLACRPSGPQQGPGADHDETGAGDVLQHGRAHVLGDYSSGKHADSGRKDQGGGGRQKNRQLADRLVGSEQQGRELRLVAELGEENRSEDRRQQLQVHQRSSVVISGLRRFRIKPTNAMTRPIAAMATDRVNQMPDPFM